MRWYICIDCSVIRSYIVKWDLCILGWFKSKWGAWYFTFKLAERIWSLESVLSLVLGLRSSFIYEVLLTHCSPLLSQPFLTWYEEKNCTFISVSESYFVQKGENWIVAQNVVENMVVLYDKTCYGLNGI